MNLGPLGTQVFIGGFVLTLLVKCLASALADALPSSPDRWDSMWAKKHLARWVDRYVLPVYVVVWICDYVGWAYLLFFAVLGAVCWKLWNYVYTKCGGVK